MKVDEIWVCVAGKAVDSLITKQHSYKGGSTGKKKNPQVLQVKCGWNTRRVREGLQFANTGDSAFQAKIKNCECGGQQLRTVWERPSVNPNSGKVLFLHQKEQSYQFFFS